MFVLIAVSGACLRWLLGSGRVIRSVLGLVIRVNKVLIRYNILRIESLIIILIINITHFIYIRTHNVASISGSDRHSDNLSSVTTKDLQTVSDMYHHHLLSPLHLTCDLQTISFDHRHIPSIYPSAYHTYTL